MVSDEHLLRAERESEYWAKLSELNKRRLSWLHSPTVDKYVNRRISGRDDVNWFGWAIEKYLTGKKPGRGLNLGCNDGIFDRQILRAGLCAEVDGYDISREAVKSAKAEAKREGLSANYHRVDLNYLELPENSYDLVVAVQSIHHIKRLEHLFGEVNRALTPTGLFIINEYVGPTQFQLPDEQLELINRVFSLLPERLKRRSTDGVVAQEITRVCVKDLVEASPFEAIRSAEIIPLIERHLKIVDRRDYGGTILCWLLNYLVPNFFEDEREEDRCIMDLLCFIEELLTKHQDRLQNDFTVIVASKQQG